MANQMVNIGTDINHTVNSGHDGVVAGDLHLNGHAFDGSFPSLALVGGIPEAFVGGGQQIVARNGQIVDEEPFVSGRRHNAGHGIVVSGIDGIKTRANETVVITLLIKAVVSSSVVAVAGANVDDAVSILNHATDHEVNIAHLMPSDTIVVGLVNTTAHGADVNDTIGAALCIQSVVIQDGIGLTTHVVRTHADPIQRVVGSVSRCRGLHGPEHVGGVNQAGVLVGTKAAHETLGSRRGLCARDIVSTLVSDNRLTQDHDYQK